MRESVKEKKVQKRYEEEFKRQAVELVIHSGRSQAQIARELGVSEYSLTLWKRAYLGHLKPGQPDGEQRSQEQMFKKIREQQKEIAAAEAFFSTLKTECFPDNQVFASRI